MRDLPIESIAFRLLAILLASILVVLEQFDSAIIILLIGILVELPTTVEVVKRWG